VPVAPCPLGRRMKKPEEPWLKFMAGVNVFGCRRGAVIKPDVSDFVVSYIMID
jgi:hypothetical protein